jgi:hypothetical protein
MAIKFILRDTKTRKGIELTKITPASSITFMEGEEVLRDIYIVHLDTFRAPPDCLSPDVSKVKTKDGVSVFDVIMGNKAVF